jgi:hypothetical protein
MCCPSQLIKGRSPQPRRQAPSNAKEFGPWDRAEAGILISESLRLTAVRMGFLLLNTSCLELGRG